MGESEGARTEQFSPHTREQLLLTHAGGIAVIRAMKKLVLSLTIATFFITSVILPTARASVIDTTSYLQAQNDSFRTEMQTFLSRDDVHKQLVALGVNPSDARDRVAALTDQELRQLQERINELPAGGDALLAVLGAVLVVLIVLELVGVTNVFNKL
jgi:urease gamma subunit